MNTQEVTGTATYATNSVYSSFVLTDLLKMASPQGVLFNLKNPQEVMQTFENIIMQSENILNFHHVRLLQGGIEVDLFVMSSLASSLFTQNSNQHTTPISRHNSDSPSFAKDAKDTYPSTATQSTAGTAVQVDYKMIEDAVNQLFQYKHFHNNNVMNESYLNHLLVVEQARQAWLDKRRPQPNTPSNQNNTSTLREFLTKCLDEHLCPEPGKSPPKALSKSDFHYEWIEYLILRQQYVDGKQRKWVKTRLQNIGAYIPGGTYGRRLKKGRERLAEIIWSLEMQAR